MIISCEIFFDIMSRFSMPEDIYNHDWREQAEMENRLYQQLEDCFEEL